MKYKASLDNLAKGVTIAVSILFAVIIVGQYLLIKDEGRSIPIYTTVALLLIYFIAFSFSPIDYNIINNNIIIHRLFGNIVIERKDIKSIELISKKQLSWSLRIFGVGGLFGYFGRFTNMKLGRMTWYATRRDTPVLITTKNNTKIIITPNDPEKFISDFNL